MTEEKNNASHMTTMTILVNLFGFH